jgi:CheY-like chemotaxis protein
MMEPPVLVVDDDPEWSSLLTMLIEREGYSVVVAANGQEALDILARIRPRAALIDLNMPVMDGRELLERISANVALASLRIALITSDSSPPTGYEVFPKLSLDVERVLAFVSGEAKVAMAT